MLRIISLLTILLSTSSMAFYVAILESYSEKNVLTHSEKTFITDKLREEACKALPAYMGHTIMTRENIETMLPPGKTIEDCEGICLVETGRNISADFVSQARIGKFGKKLSLTVELYETKTNKLIGSFTTMGSNKEELVKGISSQSKQLFEKIQIEANNLVSQKNSMTDLFIKDIQNQTITEKKEFALYNLDYLVLSSSFEKKQLEWFFTGGKDLKVFIENDNNRRIARILIPNKYWNGSETINFIVKDPAGNTASRPVTLTVLSINDAPVFYCERAKIIYNSLKGNFEPIKLSDLSFDSDNSTDQLKWTYKGNEKLIVSIDEQSFVRVSIPYTGWTGSETITFYVSDPEGASAQCKINYSVK